MKKILVVDDEPTSARLVEKILTNEGFEVFAFLDPGSALEAFGAGKFDLVVSDFFMPTMNGDALLAEIRKRDRHVPFVLLTWNTDLHRAIDMMKSGANDHIAKPIIAPDLIFRVRKNLEEHRLKQVALQIERERELMELEETKLVNWRAMYASKDADQTNQMINLMSRTINQTGGFMWLDMLDDVVEPLEGGEFRISGDMLDLIKSSSNAQRRIFEFVSFIAGIDEVAVELKWMSIADMCAGVAAFLATKIDELQAFRGHTIVLDALTKSLTDSDFDVGVRADMDYLRRIALELVINAVKFSPPGSRIDLFSDRQRLMTTETVQLVVRNFARENQAVDSDGRLVIGIPYDYCERVFDLFYTIEGFPEVYEGEEWSSGTGLYVVRKLLRRFSAWVTASNGMDYTGSVPATFVKVAVTFPLAKRGV